MASSPGFGSQTFSHILRLGAVGEEGTGGCLGTGGGSGFCQHPAGGGHGTHDVIVGTAGLRKAAFALEASDEENWGCVRPCSAVLLVLHPSLPASSQKVLPQPKLL